jgi:hypothetical protein
MKHPGHTYGGFVFAISEWGMTVHLRMIGNSLSSHYWFDEKLQFLLVRGSQLDRLHGTLDKHLMLTQPVHTKYDINAL